MAHPSAGASDHVGSSPVRQLRLSRRPRLDIPDVGQAFHLSSADGSRISSKPLASAGSGAALDHAGLPRRFIVVFVLELVAFVANAATDRYGLPPVPPPSPTLLLLSGGGAIQGLLLLGLSAARVAARRAEGPLDWRTGLSGGWP
jgi:hypothetical protein